MEAEQNQQSTIKNKTLLYSHSVRNTTKITFMSIGITIPG